MPTQDEFVTTFLITGLTPAQRDNNLAAERLVAPFNLPLVAAVEEYARCRQMLGDVPLMVAIQEFVRRNRGVQLGVKATDLRHG